jgi:predicted DCC family thiol-disulfide oxidoreductase YuxK
MNDTVLPSPAERPQADVVIFDGNCRFCRRQIATLRRFDTGQRLAYLSLHDPAVAQRYPDLTTEQLMAEMYVVGRDGRYHRGAAALRYLSRRLPRLWWLAPCLHVPGSLPLWSFLYQQVARRRYRLAGKEACTDGSCQIHASASPKEQPR